MNDKIDDLKQRKYLIRESMARRLDQYVFDKGREIGSRVSVSSIVRIAIDEFFERREVPKV